MPLQDHFQPPLSRRRHWEGLHGAWAHAICPQLNGDLLPPRYFAEAHVPVGGQVEVDVGTFDEGDNAVEDAGGSGVAVWAPPRPTRVAPLDFGQADVFEVRVLNDEEGPRLVAAIELISPANTDRPSHRRAFAVKCRSYLQDRIGLVLADVVTERSGNLHAELLELLDVEEGPAELPAEHLYAVAYRALPSGEAFRLESWWEPLAVGLPLPTLPLWIAPDRALPMDLEQAYLAACASSRIG